MLEAAEKGESNGWEREEIKRLRREIEMKERREKEEHYYKGSGSAGEEHQRKCKGGKS